GEASAAPTPSPLAPAATPSPLPASPAAAETRIEGGGLPWLWIAATLLALAALAFAGWLLRRRSRSRSAATSVPAIERPTVAPQPIHTSAAEPTPPLPAPSAEPALAKPALAEPAPPQPVPA